MTRVLVVATSRKTRGGITSVVKAHESGEHWKEFHCHWVQTHRDGPTWRKLWYLSSALADFACRLPFYDIVHIHVASYSSLKRKRIFLKLAKLFGKKTIAHFHPHKPEVLFDKEHQKDYFEFFSAVDRVIVLSPQWKRWIKEALVEHKELDMYHLGDNAAEKLYPVDKLFNNPLLDNIQVIYNPAPSVKGGAPDYSEKYILFAGIIYYRKGFDTLIRAFGRIASKHPDWKVVIAGVPKRENDAELMQKLPEELNIKDQIIYPGWVRGEVKDRLFRNASIFCLASYQEGFPMAVLDAWAYGLPCVVTPAGGLPDIIKDGENALMFEYGDDETLAAQLEKMISDDDLRSRIAAESLNLANTTFNVGNINSQIANLYTELARL